MGTGGDLFVIFTSSFLKVKERCNKAIGKTQTVIDNEAIKKVTEQEKKNTPLGVQGTQC